jgi:hypothetical protein
MTDGSRSEQFGKNSPFIHPKWSRKDDSVPNSEFLHFCTIKVNSREALSELCQEARFPLQATENGLFCVRTDFLYFCNKLFKATRHCSDA